MTADPDLGAPGLPLPAGSEGEQMALPGFPFLCGLNACGKAAVCGVQNSTYPELQINVCATCFEKMTGRAWPEAAHRDRLAEEKPCT